MEIFEEINHFLSQSRALGKKPLLVILGPTASGKTALSLSIAKKFDGEIISADSRQVYKYMDIGTDKLLPEKQEGVQHHLLDLIEPDQEFTLADYKRLATAAIEDIHRRGKLPMLVGGTGLYINAIIENYQIPSVPPDQLLREKLAKYHEEHGSEGLHRLLREQDPEAAAKIHPQNVRYVIRALEINLSSQKNKIDRKGEPPYEVFAIGLSWPRDLLYERINRRVDLQLERGLLEEVKMLLTKGFAETLPSMSSLGYRELIQIIKGELTLEEGVELFKKNTRNYAKRQLTWFRRYQNVHWVEGREA